MSWLQRANVAGIAAPNCGSVELDLVSDCEQRNSGFFLSRWLEFDASRVCWFSLFLVLLPQHLTLHYTIGGEYYWNAYCTNYVYSRLEATDSHSQVNHMRYSYITT